MDVNRAADTGEGIQNVDLPIRSMYATQETVNPDFASVPVDPNRQPFVIKKNGNYYASFKMVIID